MSIYRICIYNRGVDLIVSYIFISIHTPMQLIQLYLYLFFLTHISLIIIAHNYVYIIMLLPIFLTDIFTTTLINLAIFNLTLIQINMLII